MTPLQIQYFEEVAKESSYTQAAKNLHVTQPSVSYQIKTLEEELGVTLFLRSGKSKLSLTPAGSLILEDLKRMDSEFRETLLRATQLNASENIHIRIGITEGWVVPEILNGLENAIRQKYPLAKVYCQTHSFKTLRKLLVANELDAVLCVQTCLTNFDGIDVETVNETNACIYYNRKDFPLSAYPNGPSLQDFDLHPYYVLPDEETPLSRDHHHAYLLSHRINPTIIEFPNRDSMLLAISAQSGYAIFDTWSRYADATYIGALPLDLTIPVCVVKRKNNHNPLIQYFAEQARAYRR